jgi:hypothetical protein
MRYPITSSLEIPYIIVELFYDMTQIKKQIPKIKEKSKQNHDIQSYSCLFKFLKTSNLAARHGIIKKKKKKSRGREVVVVACWWCNFLQR